MNVKSYLFGVASGIVLTLVGLFVIGLVYFKSSKNETEAEKDPIQYLEQPQSYEGKNETSFKVFQVLGNAALARERSDKMYKWYYGNTVLILGENYYNDQIITIKNPQRTGTYTYTTTENRPMTVPVVDGDKSE